jgi:hypothetical protein
MVYFRELPVPLKELNIDLLEIFFNFANTFTETKVQQGYEKSKKDDESKPTPQMMRRMGYSEADMAEMDLRDGTE